MLLKRPKKKAGVKKKGPAPVAYDPSKEVKEEDDYAGDNSEDFSPRQSVGG
jgi:hypothetical protein